MRLFLCQLYLFNIIIYYKIVEKFYEDFLGLKRAKASKEKSMESVLWNACDKLRGSVEPAEYKHVILSLIFLKYANDRFTMQREKLVSEGKPEFMLKDVSFYAQDNVFFIPECAKWEYLMSQAKQDGLAIKIDTALHEIEF